MASTLTVIVAFFVIIYGIIAFFKFCITFTQLSDKEFVNKLPYSYYCLAHLLFFIYSCLVAAVYPFYLPIKWAVALRADFNKAKKVLKEYVDGKF